MKADWCLKIGISSIQNFPVHIQEFDETSEHETPKSDCNHIGSSYHGMSTSI